MKNLFKVFACVAVFVAPLIEAGCKGGNCNRKKAVTRTATVRHCANGSCRR